MVLDLAYHLNACGDYSPLILVMDWASRRPRTATMDGLHWVFLRLREMITDVRSPRLVASYLRSAPFEFLTHLRFIARENVRVVNFHYPTLAAFWLAVARRIGLLRVPLLFSLHGTDFRSSAARTDGYWTFYRYMLGCADAVVVVSESFRDELLARAPELAAKVAVIHNGVDDEVPAAITPGTLPSGPFVLGVSTYDQNKGLSTLLRAFIGLADELPDWRLVCIGRDGAALPALRSEVQEAGLADRVVFLVDMPHETVMAAFRQAALFCLSSQAESFGIVILEAGISGTPVIASRTGGIPEIIEDGVNGLLVPPGDVQALGAAILRLARDPDAARRLARQLREKVLSHFSWDVATEKYTALAARCAARSRGEKRAAAPFFR